MCLKSLPRESALKEIYKNEADSLEVIAATLLFAEVRVNTCVPGGTCQRFVLSEGDVFSCSSIAIALRQTVVNHVQGVLLLADTNKEIIGFHVTMYKRVGMQVLDPGKHLICDHQYSLE